MQDHLLHRVSCKVAVFSPDGTKVLAINIVSWKGYGLPGGHLDKNEEPIDCLKRELFEELAVDDLYEFELKDAWVHEDGKLVLGYTAKRDAMDLPNAPYPEQELGEWLSVGEVDEGIIGSYARFIKKFQP
jgi:8-oxo-dGTP pyrophosphatase MutT (NUDIX family)